KNCKSHSYGATACSLEDLAVRVGVLVISATECGVWAAGPTLTTMNRWHHCNFQSITDATSSTPPTPTAMATARDCSAKSCAPIQERKYIRHRRSRLSICNGPPNPNTR